MKPGTKGSQEKMYKEGRKIILGYRECGCFLSGIETENKKSEMKTSSRFLVIHF